MEIRKQKSIFLYLFIRRENTVVLLKVGQLPSQKEICLYFHLYSVKGIMQIESTVNVFPIQTSSYHVAKDRSIGLI